MKNVQEPTARKTETVATSRMRWQALIGLVAAIVVMFMVVPSRAQFHHVPPAAPSFIVLHSFAGYPTDGAGPVASLIRDAAGNLYGTTGRGGALIYYGVVFKLSPTGTETVLHSFAGPPTDGAGPVASLIRDAAGNLYGTAEAGGENNSGVVFELIRCNSAYDFKVLHSFTGGADGGYPVAGLIRDAAGNLYGTTFHGGAESSNCGGLTCGVVFKLSPTGTETVLHSFTGGPDGGNPFAGLIQDVAGNLYGTSSIGGAYGYGVVFRLAP